MNETTVIYEEDGSALIEITQVELLVSSGPDAGKSAVLPKYALTVGTHPDAGFRLSDPAVSRRHLELIPEGEGVRVRDLDSTNGTFVRGNRIAEAVVGLSSTVRVGETSIELRKLVDRHPLPLSRRRRFGGLVGSSGAMRQVYALLEAAAESEVTVLLGGETGTGKELAARALHDQSQRAAGAFVVVDCGAISATLIESELFGHKKGAFTSADRERIGAFELASGGTLFFDEIGELPLNLQPKLLRALENREIQPVGGQKRVSVDVRFVAATNRDLAEEVRRGNFREDLYYRLNVFKIIMPALRDHREDIPDLIKHFLAAHPKVSLSNEIIRQMTDADWPGNVRELRNAVERAVLLSRGAGARGPAAEEPRESEPPSSAKSVEASIDTSRPFKELKADLVDSFEKSYIEKILEENGGNISASARQAGVDRKHLERLVRKHGIEIKR